MNWWQNKSDVEPIGFKKCPNPYSWEELWMHIRSNGGRSYIIRTIDHPEEGLIWHWYNAHEGCEQYNHFDTPPLLVQLIKAAEVCKEPK